MLYLPLGSNSVLDGMAHEGPEVECTLFALLYTFVSLFAEFADSNSWLEKRRRALQVSDFHFSLHSDSDLVCLV